MIYFFIGEDVQSKSQKLKEIKKKVLSFQGAAQFDFEVLHSHKLSAEQLKKALIALPGAAKQRLIVLRECDKLSPYNKELIFHFVQNPPDTCVLILDSEKLTPRDKFVSQLAKFVNVLNFGIKEEMNVFCLTDAIARGKKVEALKTLSLLLAQGDHSLQILGALGWHWGRMRGRVSFEDFEKGLLALQEADLNIKRSRLRPEYALEVLVVKLCP